eukprot:239002-Alexandrium_andersonii.AAC.1
MNHAFAQCDPPPGEVQDPVGVASAGLASAIKRTSQARIRQWKDGVSSGSVVCRPAVDFVKGVART